DGEAVPLDEILSRPEAFAAIREFLHFCKEARKALGRIGPHAIPLLMEALKATDPDVRKEAHKALRRMGDRALPSLLAALKSRDQLLRQRTAEILGRMAPSAKDAVPALREMLHDKELRETACYSLLAIGPDAVPAFVEALRDKDREVRQAAARALG